MKLYPILESVLSEEEVFETIETLMGEEYPSSFNMEEFKTLRSYSARVRYCETHLQRIAAGTARVVFKIDNEKVLKLAKNQKGLAQNEVEISYSQYNDLEHVLARTFDYEPNNLWVEMELARKLNTAQFTNITGFKWKDFQAAIHNYGQDVNGRGGGYKMPIDHMVS